MKVQVKELMTVDVRACDPCDSLAAAAIRMWSGDCGILPVVDGGRVVGVITDRDICMALALGEAGANERAVSDVMSGAIYGCSPEDEVIEALGKMGRKKVRRLVVLLERPDSWAVLKEGLIREIHHWLLLGRQGHAIRNLGLPDSHARRISHAVAVLRADYARPLPIERLAATSVLVIIL